MARVSFFLVACLASPATEAPIGSERFVELNRCQGYCCLVTYLRTVFLSLSLEVPHGR